VLFQDQLGLFSGLCDKAACGGLAPVWVGKLVCTKMHLPRFRANQPQTNPEVFGPKALGSFGAWNDRWRGTQTNEPAGPAAGCAAQKEQSRLRFSVLKKCQAASSFTCN
jgi:hypothetical protein